MRLICLSLATWGAVWAGPAPALAAEPFARPAAAAASAQADANSPIALGRDDVEALKFKLIKAKPGLAVVTIMGFLAPGSAQAYMGHVDHTLYLWGGYLVGATAAEALIPAASVSATSGNKNADLVVGGLLLATAVLSAIDAYFLAVDERKGYDRLIEHLTEKQAPLPPLTP